MLTFTGANRPVPYGRIAGVIYYPEVSDVSNLAFFSIDLDTGATQATLAADLPGGPPSGVAGGDLAGTYPDPVVATVSDSALSANVPIMTAGVLPAVDGSLLTGLPVPQHGQASLDGSGNFSVPGTGAPTVALVSFNGAGSAPIGVLYAFVDGGGNVVVGSSAGAADAGCQFSYVAI